MLVGQSTDESDQEDLGDLLIAAFDASDLSHRWSLEWGEAFQAEDLGRGIASDGQTIVAVGAAADGQAIVLGVSLQGELLWEQRWGTSGRDDARAVAFEPGGLAVVAVDADTDLALLWIDPASGAIVDEILWGGPEDETITSLVVEGPRMCFSGAITGGPDGADQALAACFERDPLALPDPLQEVP